MTKKLIKYYGLHSLYVLPRKSLVARPKFYENVVIGIYRPTEVRYGFLSNEN
jgi:hypothetical protein